MNCRGGATTSAEQLPKAVIARAATGLPVGCPAPRVIAVLRQMILAPEGDPEQWARQLQSQGTPVTAGQVRQVQEHYALEKKRQP